MKTAWWIARREFAGYFITPIALVFLLAFVLLSVCATFFWGSFFVLNEASLRAYFYWLPFILAAFVPAVGMRLWCEERRRQTLELLLTMPLTLREAVCGKYLAGWLFLTLGLALTAPLAVTAGVLGAPDWGALFCGYLGALLVCADMLGVCSLLSALTSNQVISYVAGAVLCLFMVLGGHPSTVQFLTEWCGSRELAEMIGRLGVGARFETFQRGVFEVGDGVWLLSVAAVFLLLTELALDRRRA